MSLKTEIFYSYAYFINIFLLIVKILNDSYISIFITVFSSLFICLIRYKIIIQLLCKFPKNSILTLCFIGLSITCFFIGLNQNYELWHSLWHFCIFMSAGFACRLRTLLYESDNSSATEMRLYARTTSTSI